MSNTTSIAGAKSACAVVLQHPARRALVTGATGFVGDALTERLAEEGWDVVVLSRPASDCARLEKRGATIVRGDIGQTGDLAEAIVGCEVVFHCAAPTGLGHSIDDFHRGVTVATKNLLHAAETAGARRFVFVSSVVVYELARRAAGYDETQPLLQSSLDPYGRAKVAAEAACLGAHRPGRFEVSIVRPGFIYGPTHRRSGFLQDAAMMLARGKFRFIGDGQNIIPLTYISDLVDLLMLCADRREAGGQIYNASSVGSVSWRQFVQTLCEGLGVKMPGRVSARLLMAAAGLLESLADLKLLRSLPLSKATVRLLSQDARIPTEKAERELGFQPKVGFQAGIAGCMPMLKELLDRPR